MELFLLFILFEVASGGCLTASVTGATAGAAAGAAKGGKAAVAPRRKSLRQRLTKSRKGRALIAAGGAASLVGTGIAGAARGAAGGAARGFTAAHRVRRERVPSPAAIAVRKVRERRGGTAAAGDVDAATAPGKASATAPSGTDTGAAAAPPESTTAAPGDGAAGSSTALSRDAVRCPRCGAVTLLAVDGRTICRQCRAFVDSTAPGAAAAVLTSCAKCGRECLERQDGEPSLCAACAVVGAGQYQGTTPGRCTACGCRTVVQDGRVRCPSCGTGMTSINGDGAHPTSEDCGCDGCTAAVAASQQKDSTNAGATAPAETSKKTEGDTMSENTTNVSAEDAGITPYLAAWDQAAGTGLEAIIAQVAGTAAALSAAVEANSRHDVGGGADAIGALQHAVSALDNAQEQLLAHAAMLHGQWDQATEALSGVTADSAQELLGQR